MDVFTRSSLARALVVATVCCLSAPSLQAQAPVLMNYNDSSEVNLVLDWLAGSSHAQVVLIGHSIDYKTDPQRPAIHPIKAIRISGSTDESITDDGSKNAILFECGSHPREWLATESCLTLAIHLVTHAEDQSTEVPELLANVDVWIVPLTTPAGRAIDDRRGGDPRFFDRSVDEAVDAAGTGQGWRGNGDTRGGCTLGVNVARNFSTGWTSETSTDCTDNLDGVNDDPVDTPGNAVDDRLGDFRGFAPFSTLEAAALRNFVQNHSISMAVVIHSNATKISNLWGAADVGGTMIADLAKLAWDVTLSDGSLELTRSSSLGTGSGQFSAWLSEPSDTANQPDRGTTRAIQTIFVELPFLGSTYALGTYRYEAADAKNRSNGFHPSSSRPVRHVIESSFLFMAEELIREARSPGCSVLGNCPADDFGLVGAKIGRSSRGAGALDTHAAGCVVALVNGLCPRMPIAARDYLPAGAHHLDFRVQNFGNGTDDVNVRLTIVETVNTAGGSWSSLTTATQPFSNLARREARTGRFAVNVVAGADYTVTLQAIPAAGSADTFAANDRKVFKFRGK